MIVDYVTAVALFESLDLLSHPRVVVPFETVRNPLNGSGTATRC